MNRVLITGVSRGIGRATAEKFLREGWSVIGTATSGRSPLEHGALTVHALNLLDPKSIKKFADAIVGSKNRINVLINNAGISVENDGPQSVTIDSLRKILEVNLVGLIDLTERLLPDMADGGHVINMSSGLGSLTEGSGTYAPAYSISKTALNKYTTILSARLAGRGIIVSSIDPGWVRTDMGGSTAPRDPSEPAEEVFALANSKVESGNFWHRGRKRSW